MYRLYNNGGKIHLISIYLIRFYSTAQANSSSNFLVDFMVNSLGFSTKEAISTTSKVTRSRLKNYNPHLFIDTFEKMGLNKTHIKTLVSVSPHLLFTDVNNNLKPKIKILKELGLSGSEIVGVVTKSSYISRGFDHTIKPNVDYLRELLGSDYSVAKVVKREPRLLAGNLRKVIPPSIAVLQNHGFSWDDIETVFYRRPRYLLNKPEWLERVMNVLEKKFHFPRESRMFLHGIEAIVQINDSNIDRKLEIFRSFGWSDSDICVMVQRLPYCLATSEVKIKRTLKFFMNELGYEPGYLASHAALLKYSLENRVIPRNEVLKFLKENKLIKGKLCLYTVVSRSESEFLERYLLPYSKKMPKVYNLYLKSKS